MEWGRYNQESKVSDLLRPRNQNGFEGWSNNAEVLRFSGRKTSVCSPCCEPWCHNHFGMKCVNILLGFSPIEQLEVQNLSCDVFAVRNLLIPRRGDGKMWRRARTLRTGAMMLPWRPENRCPFFFFSHLGIGNIPWLWFEESFVFWYGVKTRIIMNYSFLLQHHWTIWIWSVSVWLSLDALFRRPQKPSKPRLGGIGAVAVWQPWSLVCQDVGEDLFIFSRDKPPKKHALIHMCSRFPCKKTNMKRNQWINWFFSSLP